MAAQLLAGKGFREVYDLQGGIHAWEGAKAWGPRGFHLDLIRGDETPEAMLAVAWGMEDGQVRFCRAAGERVVDIRVRALLERLSGIEERHRERLGHRLRESGGPKTQGEKGSPAPPETMEGGLDVAAFLEENAAFLESPEKVLELAMMVETQALDLYLRFKDRCRNEATAALLDALAEEEKGHLLLLGSEMDRALGGVVQKI